MFYPIAIHHDKDSDYGVTVPDLPGCFTASATVEEAMTEAKEAIECHIEGLMIEGEDIPSPQAIIHWSNDRAYKDAVWALVSVDLSKLDSKATRVNITLPERLLHIIDEEVKKEGGTRSGFLASAAVEYIQQHKSA